MTICKNYTNPTTNYLTLNRNGEKMMTENEIRDEIYRLFIMPMNNPKLPEEDLDALTDDALELVEKIG